MVLPLATCVYFAARCAAGQRLEYWTFAELNHTEIVLPGSALDAPLIAWTAALWGGTTWHGSYPRSAPGLRVNLIMAFCRAYMKQVRDFRNEMPADVIERNGPGFAQLIGMNALYPVDKVKPMNMDHRKAFPDAGLNPWAGTDA